MAATIISAVKTAYAFYSAQQEQDKHDQLVSAIESAKDDIINTIIDVRNTELKGRIRGRLLDFERFLNFSDTDLRLFISTSNDIIGQIEQDVLDRDLKTDNSLIPAYNTLVPLQASALDKNNDDSRPTLRRAQNLNGKFIAQMKSTVRFTGYFDRDLQRDSLQARSSFTGIVAGQLSSVEDGYESTLSGTSYYVAQKAVDHIKAALGE